jgi:hypothetical protein
MDAAVVAACLILSAVLVALIWQSRRAGKPVPDLIAVVPAETPAGPADVAPVARPSRRGKATADKE